MSDGQIYISSMGMVTSVGWDIESAAASIRAGLIKVGDVGSLETFDGDELSLPLKGCAVSGFSDGFLQTGLWARFSLTCFRQMIRYGSLPGPEDENFWLETGLFWVLPELQSERFMIPASSVDSIAKNELTGVLAKQLGLSFSPLLGHSVSGHAGIGESLQKAVSWLDSGQVKRVVIMAVDSCLDQLALTHYSSHGRLQTPQIHAGFLPGEAGAALLLENDKRAGARLEASLYNAANRPEISPDLSGDLNNSAVPYGKQLGLTIRDALEPFTDAGYQYQGDVYVDLNGESWRSAAWGIALNEIADILNFERCNVIAPAASLGEIGAAAGGVSLCLCTRAFAKKYANGQTSLICNLSENGAASAVILATAVADDE